MALRKQYKEAFAEKYGVGLGFMSFFVKAAVHALKAQPTVNASIVDEEIEYHDYMDVGVAVGTDKGLVVPVLRNTEGMSFAEIEARIKDFASAGSGGQTHGRRDDRRHVHRLQRRRLRLDDVDADPQSTAVGHPRNARHQEAGGRGPGQPGQPSCCVR